MAIRSLNKITLMGYLGKKPELVVTPKKGGGEVKRVSARLATNDSIPDGNGGYTEETDWHNLVFWGRDAEIIAQYGSTKVPLYIEGTVKNRSYQKDSQTFFISEVRVNEFIMLGNKPNDEFAAPNAYDQQGQPQQQRQVAPQQAQQQVPQQTPQVATQPLGGATGSSTVQTQPLGSSGSNVSASNLTAPLGGTAPDHMVADFDIDQPPFG